MLKKPSSLSHDDTKSWAATDNAHDVEVPPLPVLVRLLQDQDSSVMTVALKGLGALGGDARCAAFASISNIILC